MLSNKLAKCALTLGGRCQALKAVASVGGARLCCHQTPPNTIRPLGPKNIVPNFKGQAIVNAEMKTISYDDYKGKWLVFFFYPLDFTFVCPTEIIAFSDRIAEFKQHDCEVIACSCDSQFSHLAWVNTPRTDGGLGKMDIPVLSDFSKKIAADFGVLDKDTGLSYRGLFLVDPNGMVRHCLVNDLPVGRSVDEALRILKAFQFFEKHGEVCPADWEEGDDSIDVKSPKEYFKKQQKK
ncbi:peroxiredoxin [Globodera pallida]|uniref:thioredoxin-dependent peroxiredoxin n=1 Tax=Globodera pallida TaxID=36090 RepID=A0A183BN80_GLOPA|nr:peroxiredoxin [Globodera pallida]